MGDIWFGMKAVLVPNWLRRVLCRHGELSIEFHLENLHQWQWTCHSCGKVRKIR